MKKLSIGLLAAVVIGLILVGYLAAVNLPLPGRPPPPGQAMIRIPSPDELRTYFMLRTIISTVNTGLVIYLLIIYIGIYLKTRARFTVGLIIFTVTLLLYAITSNPFLHVMFRPYTLSLFDALPELFTTIAVVVLLYLSLK
jgi:hypothetical protein